MTVPPGVRDDLLEAVRRAATGPTDRQSLEQRLYATWIARAGSYGTAAAVPRALRTVDHRPWVPTARREWVDAEGAWRVVHAGLALPPVMARIYWNCPPHASGALLDAVAGALGRLRVSYNLKRPAHEALFDRCEPVVLYLGVAEWATAKTALRHVHARLACQLRPEVPPLTLRLGRGVAVAEDPGDGRSFGQSRAAAVADGLVRAPAGVADDALVTTVVSRFPAHDISPSRPYLRAGSPPDRVTAW